MRLMSISYREYEGRDLEWALDGLLLGQRNLLVGKNATGKSRTLNIIGGLAAHLTGQRPPSLSGNYLATFEDHDHELVYHLRYESERVTAERFAVDGRVLLARGEGGVGRIWAEKYDGGKEMEFQAPPNELAAVVRRDTIQHPYFQPLHDWAVSVRHYQFGTSLGKDQFAVIAPRELQTVRDADDKDASQVVRIFRKAMLECGESAFKDAMLRDLDRVGYPADDIGVGPPVSFRVHEALPGALVGLRVKEKGLRGVTDQFTMSQGMFRVVSILTLTNYLTMMRRAGCLLIDDIGEGLDFERSCQLIDLLREKAERSSVQLVASTNDRFVMNRVPLEEWSVLHRRGSQLTVLNHQNSRVLFEEFKFTGLSNFSFLEMDFASGPPAEEEQPA